MIERLFIKDCLSFDKVDIDLNPGLIVFTGASGVGKTVLMRSILGLIGQGDSDASSSELLINFPFDLENYQTEGVSVIQQQKKEKTKLFLNDLTISKKRLGEIGAKYIDFMNVKDLSIFEQTNLIGILDSVVEKKEKGYTTLLNTLSEQYHQLKTKQKELLELQKKRDKVEELKSFLEFEIDKIKKINPIDDSELEELNKIKIQLSHKEKIGEMIIQTQEFFENQHYVTKLLDFLEVDSSAFEESVNNAFAVIEETQNRFEDLEYVDIEETLTRIEQLHSLVKKYGSIGECLVELDKKEKELSTYTNIEFEEQELQKEIKRLEQELSETNNTVFKLREKQMKEFNVRFKTYTDMLFLNNVVIELQSTEEMNPYGAAAVNILLNKVPLTKVSAGEINRLKLATLVIKSQTNNTQSNGVLILDEIDANLSGKESESIGKLLFLLSKNYQILSISHQPQLTSFASQHFLVEKNNNVSSIRELVEEKERLNEIARMVSGSNITDKAFEFASELFKHSKHYKSEN